MSLIGEKGKHHEDDKYSATIIKAQSFSNAREDRKISDQQNWLRHSLITQWTQQNIELQGLRLTVITQDWSRKRERNFCEKEFFPLWFE